MAKRMGRGGGGSDQEFSMEAVTVPDQEHPEYVDGRLSDADDHGDYAGFTPVPNGPLPGPLPVPVPRPIPTPILTPVPSPFVPGPIPLPLLPSFCGPVSGRYTWRSPRLSPTPLPVGPGNAPQPILPFHLHTVTVRVDVDRFYPQRRISMELATRSFPRTSAHVIAEVTSDHCTAFNRRRIVANIVYRDGNAALIPGTTMTFIARRTNGTGYGAYELQLSAGGTNVRTYSLSLVSQYFDPVEIEVDRVANSGTIVTTYNTGSHPNRPASLPMETLSLATVYQRAGFDATMSPNSSVIPVSGAGANGTWSDAEMHNAMVTYWSRFAARPKWALWVLYAARHDLGRSLGGIMFDDIGPNHRQGTAIFTDSFIQDAPAGDTSPAAWRNRMQFWTAIHEMGHAFNLAHSWQKSLGTPWIPLDNEPEARSFMNYPFNVASGQSAFFSNFAFRFSDQELLFMRHAPRRFVQMGNSNWFVNHGFEAPEALQQTGHWKLRIRPNRDNNTYQFLEPLTLELKLTNTSGENVAVDGDILQDGRHIAVLLQREGGLTRQWRPMLTHCHAPHHDRLDSNASIFGSHMISTTTDGWLIHEPGIYKVQAAIDMGSEIVVSNVLRVFVAQPSSHEEEKIAPDYFTEDVARMVTMGGAPELTAAEDVLRRMCKVCSDNPAAVHAEMALSTPMLRDFKLLKCDAKDDTLAIKTQAANVAQAVKTQVAALLNEPDKAADTIGHIHYFQQLRDVAEIVEKEGDEKGAVEIMSKTIAIMKSRQILPSIIANAEARLSRRE